MDPLAFFIAHHATRDGIRGAEPNERPRRRPATAPAGASDARALPARGERGGGRRARALRALVQRP